jgi:hypothetical protein
MKVRDAQGTAKRLLPKAIISIAILLTTDVSQPGMSISVAFLAQRFFKVSCVFLPSLFLSLSLSLFPAHFVPGFFLSFCICLFLVLCIFTLPCVM